MSKNASRKIVAHRIMPRIVIALCLFAGLASVWIWQPPTNQTPTRFLVRTALKNTTEQETVIQNRNLSDYDLGDEFTNCASASFEEVKQCNNAQDKGREFIWNHWKSKKRGYIVYVASGADVVNEVNIFIEPDENGTWHIIQRWILRSPGYSINNYYKVASEKSTMIKRRRNKNNDDLLEGGRFYLLLLDEDGKEVSIL